MVEQCVMMAIIISNRYILIERLFLNIIEKLKVVEHFVTMVNVIFCDIVTQINIIQRFQVVEQNVAMAIGIFSVIS